MKLQILAALLASASVASVARADGPVLLEENLTAEESHEIRLKGVAERGALELSPGEYSVRFVVRDDLTGRMGSISAPLRIE